MNLQKTAFATRSKETKAANINHTPTLAGVLQRDTLSRYYMDSILLL